MPPLNGPRLLFRLLLGRRLPITSGALMVGGISAPVTIRRDAYAIPYIEAQTDEDAWFGLGFCQGQDRAFQIESYLRVVRGTLSEIAGPETLAIDRLSRRIGFRRAAEEQLDAIGDYERGVIEAFARGVNAGVSMGSRRKAHEFPLLRAKPTPYEAADVVAVQKLLSFTLAANWDMEL
ncbi:MAG: penicillin acylase family protein, partial [Chloroflexi bacterium]|nr:penicillin acylase family protein [Chloroflexota bacterium]